MVNDRHVLAAQRAYRVTPVDGEKNMKKIHCPKGRAGSNPAPGTLLQPSSQSQDIGTSRTLNLMEMAGVAKRSHTVPIDLVVADPAIGTADPRAKGDGPYLGQ
jgi:hypothetical protein